MSSIYVSELQASLPEGLALESPQGVAYLDERDGLSSFRSEFLFPRHENISDVVYLCGNSLGLQPKSLESEVVKSLHKWSREAVEGHFTGPLIHVFRS